RTAYASIFLRRGQRSGAPRQDDGRRRREIAEIPVRGNRKGSGIVPTFAVSTRAYILDIILLKDGSESDVYSPETVPSRFGVKPDLVPAFKIVLQRSQIVQNRSFGGSN